MLYHYQRLVLLKSDFLISIENGDIENYVIFECQASAHSLICINKAFVIAKPSGIEDQSMMHKMVIYLAGLVHVSIASVSRENVDRSLNLLIEASKLITYGPKFEEELLKCRGDYRFAVGLLRRFRNCNVY